MKNPNRTASIRRPCDGPDTLIIVNSKKGSSAQYAKWLMKALDTDIISYDRKRLGYSAYYKNVIFIGWIRDSEITKLSVMRTNYSNFHLNEKNFIVAGVGVAEETPEYRRLIKGINGISDLPDERFYLLPGRFDCGKVGGTDAAALKALGDKLYSGMTESDAAVLRERLENGYDGVDVKEIAAIVDYVRSLRSI